MSSEKTETVSPAATPPEQDLSFQLMTFLEVYKKQVGIVILVGAVVAIVGYAYTANQEKKEAEAATALALVELNASPVNTGKPPAPKPEDLFKVATDFDGTNAAEQALLRGAVALFEANKFADAQKKFEEFAAKYPDSEQKATADLGVAASLEALKQFDRAAEAYQRVVTSYPTQSVATQAKLGLASVNEQKGQPAAALKLYEEVAMVRPGTAPSGWVNEATNRKERLLADHPELVVAAPAAKPATTPAPAMTLPVKK